MRDLGVRSTQHTSVNSAALTDCADLRAAKSLGFIVKPGKEEKANDQAFHKVLRPT